MPGQLRNATAQDRKAFPGCTYAINNSVPSTECQETSLTDVNQSWDIGGSIITLSFSIADIWLIAKECSVAGGPDTGNYLVTAQPSDTTIVVNYTFTAPPFLAQITIHDVAENFLTRSQRSFAAFVRSQPQPYTCKGGQLYTSTPNPPMSDACSVLFNPS